MSQKGTTAGQVYNSHVILSIQYTFIWFTISSNSSLPTPNDTVSTVVKDYQRKKQDLSKLL